MRARVSVAAVGAAVVLGGCSPDGAWSKDRVQGWAERAFPVGTPGADVRTELEYRHVEFNDQRFCHGEDPEITAWFDAPAWWVLSVKLVTFCEPRTGVTFRFDAADRVQSIQAWKEYDGP